MTASLETPAIQPQRRFRVPRQFSLATLLIFMTVLAALLGWVILPHSYYRAQAKARRDLSSSGVRIGKEVVFMGWLGQLLRDEPWAKTVSVEFSHSRDVNGPTIALLNEFPRLKELTIHGSLLDCDLGELELPMLERLAIHSRSLERDLSFVRNFPRLSTLDLAYSKVQDSALATLGRLDGLTELRLERTIVGDDGLAYLRDLPALENLNLSQTRVTDAGLSHLRTLPSLTILSLNHTSVTGGGFETWADSRLQELGLYHAPVDDAGLACVAQLKMLHTLALNETLITDAGLAYLMRLQKLERLSLSGSKVTRSAADQFLKSHPGCGIDIALRP